MERGAKLYETNCAGCHGVSARGGVGAPDLIRSSLVLDDEKGILIAPVLRNGRPDAGMPKPNLTEAEIGDVIAWLHVQTFAAGHRTTYAFKDVLTGDAKKGEAYFATTCSGCHSAGGDLKGIGSRYDAFALQARWLQPRGGRGGGRGGRGEGAGSARGAVTVTVTLASGQKVSGTLDRADDFSVSLHDASGEYHSFTRDGDSPKVEVHDPLKPQGQSWPAKTGSLRPSHRRRFSQVPAAEELGRLGGVVMQYPASDHPRKRHRVAPTSRMAPPPTGSKRRSLRSNGALKAHETSTCSGVPIEPFSST